MKPVIGAALAAVAAASALPATTLAAVNPTPMQGSSCVLKHFTVSGASTTYDPFQATSTPVPIAMTVETSGSCTGARVQFALTPSPTSPNTGSQVMLSAGGQTPLMASVDDSSGQPRQITTAAAAFNSSQMSLPVGSSGLLSSAPPLQLDISTGQTTAPGSYQALLTVVARIVDGSGGAGQSSLSAPLSLNVNVQPSVYLAAGSSSLSIDLGELTPGVYGAPVSFDAYANVDYEINLQSTNGFNLARDGHGGAVGGVPYLPIISGQTVTASASNAAGAEGSRAILFSAPNGGGRQHQTFSVQVLPFNHAIAADYSDQVTLQIRARV